MAIKTFKKAKKNKSDEFYTQMIDIEKEIKIYLDYNPDIFKNKTILCPCDNPYESNFFKYFVINFKKFGLKKLIATCYNEKPYKIEIKEIPIEKNGNINEIEWLLTSNKNILVNLSGDGDFRSSEVSSLRDESDFIITNPPFSLFRDFIKWIIDGRKKFLVISNINAITYKEVFPLIKENKIWMGLAFGRNFKGFIVPDNYPLIGKETIIDSKGNRIVSTNNTIWLTNIEHGYRHKPIELMTMEENLKRSRHKKIIEKGEYNKYDNCKGIDIPYTDSIPSDYDGIMGVPISFLHKYCPEQFEIIRFRKGDNGKDLSIDGKCPYFRILIKNKISIQK